MASFTFEGETDNINARQLEYITSVLENRGFQNGKVTIEDVGKAGDNYGSTVKRIIINKDGEPFKMIAKIAPSLEIIRTKTNLRLLFLNEDLMYTVILPKFAALEKEAGIPVNDRLRFATCYGTLMEEPNEIILLEDLNVANFVMLDRFKSLTSDCVKLVLKNFAKLHSLSYVLKTQEPETFKEYCEKLVSFWEFMENMKEMDNVMVHLETSMLAILDNEEHRKRVKNSISRLLINGMKNIKFFRAMNYSVIQQGDSWTNNIMFKLVGENVVECCMIDYQLPSHNGPVADLHYMIFNCTDYETCTKHYQEWIDYYYSELDKRLYNFGLKVNDIYTRDRLEADLLRQAKIAFAQSLMGAGILSRENDEAAKVKESVEKSLKVEEMLGTSHLGKASQKKYKNKVEELIQTFLELGYI